MLVTVVVVAIAVRSGVRPGSVGAANLPADWSRRFNRVGLVQGVAIGLAVLLLAVTRSAELIPAVICLIVGIHFLPLAGIFDQPGYRWTAAALCVVAVAGSAAFAAGYPDSSRAVVGLGAALVLWSTSGYVTVKG